MSDHVKESGTNWAVSPSPKTLVRDSWHDVVLNGYVRALVLGRSVLDECVYVSINQDAATVSSCLRLAHICADKSDSTFDLLLKANDVEPEQIRQSVEEFRRVCRLLEAECKTVVASGCITDRKVRRVFISCATHAFEGEHASTTFIEAWYEPEADPGGYLEEFLNSSVGQ